LRKCYQRKTWDKNEFQSEKGGRKKGGSRRSLSVIVPVGEERELVERGETVRGVRV
jgi:hypothetical protein